MITAEYQRQWGNAVFIPSKLFPNPLLALIWFDTTKIVFDSFPPHMRAICLPLWASIWGWESILTIFPVSSGYRWVEGRGDGRENTTREMYNLSWKPWTLQSLLRSFSLYKNGSYAHWVIPLVSVQRRPLVFIRENQSCYSSFLSPTFNNETVISTLLRRSQKRWQYTKTLWRRLIFKNAIWKLGELPPRLSENVYKKMSKCTETHVKDLNIKKP